MSTHPTPSPSHIKKTLHFYIPLWGLWILLWWLPNLQGDDRHFATASRLPWGYQNLPTVIEFVDKTWRTYNGRVADGLGVLWYLFGDSVARVIFAFSYVIFAFLIEQWLKTYVKIPDKDLLLSRFLIAGIPFLLIASHSTIAGESVMLAAAVWNYIIPLNLILISLYPYLRELQGHPLPRIYFFLSLPFIFISMQMHEMLMIALVALTIALTLVERENVHLSTLIPVGLSLATGAIAKILAPGLWNRAAAYKIGTNVEGYTPLEQRIVRLGSAFSDIPVYYTMLLILLLLLIYISLYKRTITTLHHKTPISIAATLTIISGLLWGAYSWAHRLRIQWVNNEVERLPGTLSPYNAALISLFALIFTLSIGYLIFLDSKERKNPLPFAFYTGSTLALYVTAVMSPYLYGFLNRAHYVTLLFLGVTIVVYLLELLHKPASSSFSKKATLGLAAVGIALSFMALIDTSVQLIQNRLAWEEVETNIENVKAGIESTIFFPDSLPCPDLTWYYWPEDHERSYQQLSIYYNISEQAMFQTIPQDRGCIRIF